ncbi:DUF2809 domain-containing protein [Pradoshia sp. D12]|uniref:ribosomal maturation YjgA family protein n=1 Tax=Bacillaceae TaxID=186817 RepID=UPI00112B0F4F|nr:MULTISPECIES: DUF2809 domain-containing protein [Bacillaceae]QFK71929.1 DUF2809 domain-containing protein [Pradoshia sp. D12]TPF73723.1 DUF2809 domain-containing protein [Bacillus sp. D12]
MTPINHISRFFYLTAIILCIILGLASRLYSSMLHPFLAQHAGDALWAMMVYFGFRFLFVQKKPFLAFGFSVLFSFGIEFSQLYQAAWINQIRNTTIGALILGKGFLWIDLLRYTLGIMMAVIIDWLKINSIKTNK